MSRSEHPYQPPPKWLDKLLERFCSPKLLEEVLGDLHERYYLRLKKDGLIKARRNYWREVLAYLRLSSFKKPSFHFTLLISQDMIRNYLTIARRNLSNHKTFSALNILGLVLSMTSSLLIFLWIQDELAVDNFHADNDRLYTIYQTIEANGQLGGSYSTPVRSNADGPYLPIEGMADAVPEIENMVYYATGYELPWGHPETFQVGDNIHKLEGSRASQAFFSMFNYPLIAGNAKTALAKKNSIAISETMAQLFFDRPEEAIGQSIRYENRLDFEVTAVFEDISSQSSLQFEFLIDWESQMTQLEWASGVMLTTVRLSETADIYQVTDKINRFLQSRLDDSETTKTTLGLQPFTDRYLRANFANGKPQGGRIEYVRIFSGVAIFLLVIACINFMNLATARSIKRAREVGVRKAIGSSRMHLIWQFLGESILLSLLALIFTIVLVQLLLPSFNQFTTKHITIPIESPIFWLLAVGLMLLVGLLAGSYPALYLSSLKPARVLKGSLRTSPKAIWLRKGLAVFQFSLSILLLIITLVVSRQINYVQNKHLGYDRENLIYTRIEGELNEKYAVLKEQLLNMPGIAMVDRSSEAPHTMGFLVDEVDGFNNTGTGEDAINWEGKEAGQSVAFKPTSVGYDFVKVMNLEIAEGRDFSKSFSTDSTAFLINEAAAQAIGMQAPLGKWISAWDKKGTIVGVLKDYHTHSLHEPIKPLIVDIKEDLYFGVILVRTEPGKTTEALASMEEVFREINPNYPLNYQFIDSEYQQLYQTEQVAAKLSNVFAGIAISISCLGLLGLVMFSTQQRVKEIGIRKVLGAEVTHIVGLLSKDFLQSIVVAFLVATPIAVYLLNQWLDNFAYRVQLSWWIFIVAGVLALLVALLTTASQTIKAALANPVESLRNE